MTFFAKNNAARSKTIQKMIKKIPDGSRKTVAEMKFIHLSDLHLGKKIKQYSMLEDQEYILKQILKIIDDEKPDAVIIAGDIYDKSVPPAEAVQLFDDFIFQLAKKKLNVFAIAGNHDSPERLSFGSRIMDTSGIHFSKTYNGKVEAMSLEDDLKDDSDDDKKFVDIFMLPFVNPAIVRRFYLQEEAPEETEKENESENAAETEVKTEPETEKTEAEKKIKTYTDAVIYAISKMKTNPKRRNILVAHQNLQSAVHCDSENISASHINSEDNTVEYEDAVDIERFKEILDEKGFDYVALGHLHTSQNFRSDKIRYSGTPLKYSLSEVKRGQKSVTVVDIPVKGKLLVHTVPLVPKYDMVEIKGTFAQITSPQFYKKENLWEKYVYITLTDDDMILDAMGKLRPIYPRIMELPKYENTRANSNAVISETPDLDRKTPFDIFSCFFTEQNGYDMSDEQADYMKNLIKEIWEEEK